jgi:hypothetical protein
MAAAPLIGAGVSVVGSVLGGKSQKKAQKKALAAQTAMHAEDNALIRENRDLATARFAPYSATGEEAMGNINSLLRGDQSAFDAFRNSTNYNDRLNEGLRGVNQGYAGIGGLNSGAAIKSLNNYAQSKAGDALGGYASMLQGQQNLGFGAASALAGVGNNFTNATVTNNQNYADNQSNAALLRGQTNANMYGGIFNALGSSASSFFPKGF